MEFPGELKYTESDEWVRVDGTTATIGITDFAQDQLSDIVYLEYAVESGDAIGKGDSFGAVESVKAASDIYSPVSGTVTEINEILTTTPEMINSDPYGGAWLIKIELGDDAQVDALFDADAYQKSTEERS
jgi:glycine cleavage system H protein